MAEALDSAVPWVAKHTRKYVETDGEEGHLWNGAPDYDQYQAKTERDIPVVVLERA